VLETKLYFILLIIMVLKTNSLMVIYKIPL